MNEYLKAVFWLKKIRPKFNDERWLRAFKVIKELEKKSTKDRETKERLVIYLADEIYKDY